MSDQGRGSPTLELSEEARLVAAICRYAVSVAKNAAFNSSTPSSFDVPFATSAVEQINKNIALLDEIVRRRPDPSEWDLLCREVRTTSRIEAMNILASFSKRELSYMSEKMPAVFAERGSDRSYYLNSAFQKLGSYFNPEWSFEDKYRECELQIRKVKEYQKLASLNWPDDINLFNILSLPEHGTLKCAYISLSEDDTSSIESAADALDKLEYFEPYKHFEISVILQSAIKKLGGINLIDTLNRFEFISSGGLDIGGAFPNMNGSDYDPELPLYSIDDFNFSGYSSQLELYITEENLHPNITLSSKIEELEQFIRDNPGAPVEKILFKLFPEILESHLPETKVTHVPVAIAQPVALWDDRRPGETPVSFIMLHYGIKRGDHWDPNGLTKPELKRLDSKLYQALATWERRHPEDKLDLPTRTQVTESWVDRVQKGDEDLPQDAKSAMRLASAMRRKAFRSQE